MIDAKKILKISVVTLLTLIIAGIVAFLIASPILKGQIEEKQTQLATNGIIKETSQKTTPIVEEPTIPETLPNEFNVLLLGVDSNEAQSTVMITNSTPLMLLVALI